MLIITDLKNNAHALLANKTIKKELNGDHIIELEVHQQKNNALDLNSIDYLWTVTYKDIDYKIVYIDTITKGNSFYLKLRGKPLFYDEFSTSVIHPRKNGSITFSEAFNLIFANTSFIPILEAQRTAATWDGFGNGESRLDLFKKAIDKFNVEFEVVGSRVYLRDMIGNETNFLYKYKLNASNISKTIDATTYYTHRKGFGNFKEGEEDYYNKSLLKREYTSPIASIIGVREMSPPLVDGRVKDAEYMDKILEDSINDSLSVTVSATLHDLRKQGYPHGIPTIGDRTFLLDERIGLKQEIRVTGIEERYDEQDVLKDCKVDFGSQSIRKRYASKMSSVMKTVTDMMKGFVKLPFATLDVMAQEMIKKIQSVSTELVFDNGIFAIDKNNPNNIVGLNSAGWYISTDGGRTSRMVATAEGLVAESIVGKSLIGLNITSPGATSYFHVNGGDAEFVDTTNNRKVSVSPDGVYGKNADGDIRFQMDRSLVTSSALGTSNLNVYLAADDIDGEGEVRAVKYSTLGGSGDSRDYKYINIRARSLKSPIGSHFYIGTDAGELRVMSQGLSEKGTYQDMRCANIYANRVESHSSDGLYLGSAWEVAAVKRGSGTDYVPMRASAFNNTSKAEYKNSIEKWEFDALSVVKDVELYSYKYNSDGHGLTHHGVVIGDGYNTPSEWIFGDGVDLYEMITWSLRSIQQLSHENDEIKKENESLRQRMDKLEERIETLESK